MENQLLQGILEMVFSLVNRHLEGNGQPPLTDEDTATMKAEAYTEGVNIINRWFIDKGLPPPQ